MQFFHPSEPLDGAPHEPANPGNNMKTRPTLLSLAIASVFAATPLYAQQTPPPKKEETEKLGTISVLGQGDQLGTGQMVEEDAPKARSTTTKAALDKQRTTQNPFQGMALLPGVNTFSHDATGLFGGGLRVRGFNSDQMGFTVDGAPVNDSGSFSVFPQEYTDAENMCELFVTQGSPDNDAPHVGASGGNVGVVTCDPLLKTGWGGKLQQTLGEQNLSKTFVRLDTGRLPVGQGWASFLSFSHSQVDKWKGLGGADRDHIDFRSVLQLGRGNRLSVTALWNDAVNHNLRTGTKAQFTQNYYFDFDNTFVGNATPVAGTRQTPPAQGTFYGLALNPFKNAIVTIKGTANLWDKVRLDVEPYFWYGYGTGGVQQFTLNEGGTFRGGVADLNGDGDRLDSVIIYRASVTKTHRPGGTAKISFAWANHRISAGYWYERARHRQTGPGTRLDANGVPADLWLEGSYVLRVDGSPYQLRDQLTISRAGNLFINDTMGFLGEKLRVDVGVKQAFIDRDFRNYANEGFGAAVDYVARKKYDELLPTLGVKYQLDARSHVFMNVAKNFKAPGNFSFQGLFPGGVSRVDTALRVLGAETSVSSDIGYRYAGPAFKFSGSLYQAKFKDRLARRFIPEESLSIDTNVGDGYNRGIEMELGTVPVRGWSAYVSGSWSRSRNESDLRLSATNTQPTAGKQFPDSPRLISAASVQYARDKLYAQLQAKYTGKRFSTLVNDEEVPGYTTFDLNAGYAFGNMAFMKGLILRANISNITNKRYLASNAGSGSLFTTNATGVGAQSPSYYAGAPRFASVSLSAEF